MQELDESAGSYIEFSLLQLEQQKSGTFEEQLAFWQKEFATPSETLPLLPMARVSARPVEPGQDSHHEYRELNNTRLTKVKETCQRLHISPIHFHLTVLQILLSRYTNTQDISLGVVDANRNDSRFVQTVGCFINMLPVRFHVPSHGAFAGLAKTTSRKALAAFAHGAVPFDMILDRVKAPRSPESTPLFQAAVNYRSGAVLDLKLGDSRMRVVDAKDADNPYDLSLGITDTSEGCIVELHCQASLYSSEACRIILDSYLRLLESFSVDSDTDIGEPALHDEVQVNQALELGKGAEMNFGWPPTLSQRVFNMCRLRSNSPAI